MVGVSGNCASGLSLFALLALYVVDYAEALVMLYFVTEVLSLLLVLLTPLLGLLHLSTRLIYYCVANSHRHACASSSTKYGGHEITTLLYVEARIFSGVFSINTTYCANKSSAPGPVFAKCDGTSHR